MRTIKLQYIPAASRNSTARLNYIQVSERELTAVHYCFPSELLIDPEVLVASLRRVACEEVATNDILMELMQPPHIGGCQATTPQLIAAEKALLSLATNDLVDGIFYLLPIQITFEETPLTYVRYVITVEVVNMCGMYSRSCKHVIYCNLQLVNFKQIVPVYQKALPKYTDNHLSTIFLYRGECSITVLPYQCCGGLQPRRRARCHRPPSSFSASQPLVSLVHTKTQQFGLCSYF